MSIQHTGMDCHREDCHSGFVAGMAPDVGWAGLDAMLRLAVVLRGLWKRNDGWLGR